MADTTMRAVRFERYGGPEELQVVEVPRPTAAPGRAVVQVVAASINPGEDSIRAGRLHERWPATFPEGEGSDLAGIVTEVGEGVSSSIGVTPVSHGEGLAARLRAVALEGVNAFIDCFGGGYVDLAIELGVPTDRIDTIIDWPAAARTGAKAEGMATVKDPAAVLTELANLVASGQLTVPIARTYPLGQVQDAYRELAQRHTRGKIVLLPTTPPS